ncbi:glycosyltransferase family 4 protein [Algoriphagus halophytocola]|uniref:glycosyltransferase family 4 protein n=1 Tax=Algoriphagus halophytocola TaxID=2991499 RepID=UPI0022DE7016|nr:glycosyltransferase family 4 protein [Algoriphagus sp. TR-M9]WBL41300.1 glycosyltransferase family 4 protein [Algoriphagus sp. TR-M9]
MKVVRIVSELDFGGVEKVLANSLPVLHNQEGIELKLIVLGKGGKVADELAVQGIPIQTLGFNPRIPNFKLLKKLQRILSEFRPDVVHCQGGEANFHGIWAAKIANVPLIIGEEIGIPNHHSFWKYIFKWIYRKADRVIAISEAVKRNIVELGEVEERKVKVVYNPVSLDGRKRDFSFRSSSRNDGGEFVFVCTCRLVPIKNLGRLIEAFGGLVKANPDRELQLRIIGEGPERESLELRIKNEELSAYIEILGFQEDVWSFLMAADTFVIPSLREGSSVSLAEAMTAGLPSIVTQVGGAAEILGNSQSGNLIDPLSIDSIQSAMQQMIDFSREEREDMGERAKKESERFSVENYIQSLMQLYSNSEF